MPAAFDHIAYLSQDKLQKSMPIQNLNMVSEIGVVKHEKYV
jgi:hypothetical protein